MGNRRKVLTATALAVLLTTSFLITLATVPKNVSAYTVHDPIFIDGDADFTAANGVTGGSGTESDPFTIEGWDIDASLAHGIWIQGTNAYFQIRNCYVHDSGGAGNGIYLYGCVNGTVKGNTCSCNDFGIHLSSSSGITLSNNNCSSNNQYGIRLNFSSDNALGNNTCSNNGCGIYLSSSSDNNTLVNNTCSSNSYHGIANYFLSDNNTLVNNTCSSNDYVGIDLHSSSDNTLTHNNCSSNNHAGIRLAFLSDSTLSNNNCLNNGYGIELDASSDNTLSGNTCSDNDCGIFVSSPSDNTLNMNTCCGNSNGIYLTYTMYTTLRGNNCSMNLYNGLFLYRSNNNTLDNNSCRENGDYGMDIAESNDNTLSSNNASSNSAGGVYISDSTGTSAYHNIFFDNADHAFDDGGSENLWNASYPIGGNYWDNYTGVDEYSGPDQNLSGSDGIGDASYFIDADSVDYYPLMEPPNRPPVASFTVSPATGYVNTVFSVDASSSSDEEDDFSELEVRWDWESDGTWDTSWSVTKTDSHQYSVEGIHTITLEVRDTKGLTDDTTRQVTVVPDDVPPVADAGTDQTVSIGEEVMFDGSGSSDNIGIVNYTWTFVDGVEKTLHEVRPTYTFNDPGEYTVTLNAADAADNHNTDTVVITVEEEEQEEEEEDGDDKSFLESYGLPIGIVVALAIIALTLLFMLRGQKGGKAPTGLEDPPSTKSEGQD